MYMLPLFGSRQNVFTIGVVVLTPYHVHVNVQPTNRNVTTAACVARETYEQLEENKNVMSV